ncbi:family 43 glycosylhydrolase [Asanoa sp. NPDC050611]|uniref:family 43 glycosylhydrolase n=1 Tax=Asanoa sp. NPDC050611 TaxID=3157098 RepID=UPI0033DB3990
MVGPRPAPGGGFLWTFDPAGLTDASGQRWLYYGSYFGGIWTVPLSADGLRVTGAATQVTIDNRYEGAYVVRRGGWYYLFGSAANCCAGPTTGYSVFAGRAKSPTGPFVDRDGHSLLASRVGGTPVIQPNGNRWIGTGHNAVVTDDRGRDWFVYHAIDRGQPYLDEPYGINRRPMLVDRLDWVGGWPTVRGGDWASDPGVPDESWKWAAKVKRPAWSDEFSAGLAPGWSWVRPDPDATVTGGGLRWPTQAADLVGTANDASVLLRDAPAGDWVVETKLSIDLGVDTVRNYQQAGLVVYAGDDDFARLSHVAIWNTRQVEYGRELPYADRLSYGGMVETPPAETTWLRLAHRTDRAGEHEYRAAVSTDGRHWTWGGVWTFPAGPAPRIGLVSHGGDSPQATALFDYVRFYRR